MDTSYPPPPEGQSSQTWLEEARQRVEQSGASPTAAAGVTVCLSQQRGRLFFDAREYAGEKALDAAIAEAKQALPAAESSYKASGATTTSAALMMCASSPVIIIGLIIVCAIIGLLYEFISGFLPGVLSGLLGLLVDIVLLVIIVFGIQMSLVFVGKKLKNRNAGGPALLAAMIALIVSGLVFFLSPSVYLTFHDMGIHWVLIPLGILGSVIGAAAATHNEFSTAKFCEVSGVFLKAMRKVEIPFDWCENALATFKSGDLAGVRNLPPAVDDSRKGIVTLWWHPEAQTGYVEMEVLFRGISKPQKKMTIEKPQDKSERWMVFSVPLDRQTAEWLNSVYGEPRQAVPAGG